MKALILLLALLSSAVAQPNPLPKTITLYNKATKEPLGTATHFQNKIYFRDKDGVLYATIEAHADGTRTAYDVNGKVIPLPPLVK